MNSKKGKNRMSSAEEAPEGAMTLEVYSPSDGVLLKTIPLNSSIDAARMLTRARQLFADRDGWLPDYKRVAILKELANLMHDEAEAFAELIALEGGKPLEDARVEVQRAIYGVELAAEGAFEVMSGAEVPMGRTAAARDKRAFTTFEPIGVVLAVSAFNHPLNLIVHQVIPAIAVGCPVIVKPAAKTPLNCLRLVELLAEAGLPKGWCQVCVCDNDVAEKMVRSEQINFFSFIGSAKVGWYLKSILAPGVRCALEHGGVAPAIVDQTANLDATVASILHGAFYHAGQVCVSTQRVFAERSIIATLAKKLAEGAARCKVGHATKEGTDVGPLIDEREVDRVDAWVQEAIASGATCLQGGYKLNQRMYAPTVLLTPAVTAKVSTEEVFGPVVSVYGYRNLREAIDTANSLDMAFQAAVYSRDLYVVEDCIKYLDATAVMVNENTAFRTDWMPFAGRRQSGYGVGGIEHSMRDMVQPKMAVIHLL